MATSKDPIVTWPQMNKFCPSHNKVSILPLVLLIKKNMIEHVFKGSSTHTNDLFEYC